MVKLEVCIGTACHLRGSREVIETFQSLISKNGLKNKIDFSGKFCLGHCENKGVGVSVNGIEFDVNSNDTLKFFEDEVLPLIK